jgi:NhaP-type Na+/H+ or K+/H+ antiporter
LAAVSLAILSYSLAEWVHGNGFIAAYFSGLFLSIRSKEIRHRIKEFGEAESQMMVLFIFLLFGLLLVPMSFPYWDLRAWLYALLSLTVIRIVPVLLSLKGTDLSRHLKVFIAWFGPRGIASVLYLLMMVIQLGAKGHERIISVIALTVLLSTFFHGISAVPYSNWIGRLEGKKVDFKSEGDAGKIR